MCEGGLFLFQLCVGIFFQWWHLILVCLKGYSMCLIVFLYAMQKLPQFPLPTHDVIVRGVIPLEFEVCVN